MRCEDCQERLTEYLLNELPHSEAATIEAHLEDGCQACAERLAELAIAADWILGGIQTDAGDRWEQNRSQVWSQVFEHLEEAPVEDDSQPTQTAEHTGSRFDNHLRSAVVTLLAMACAFAAIVTLRFPDTSDRSSNDPGALMQLASQPIRSVSLHAPDNPARESGTIVYDPVARQIHIYLGKPPEREAGEKLFLWLRTADGKWSIGGELSVETGVIAQIADLPPLSSPLASIAIAVQKNTRSGLPDEDVSIVSESLAEDA